MTENNTEQTRSSQHRHTKKKAPTSSKKKLWKKILIGIAAFVTVAIIAIVAIFAYYGATAPTIQASDLEGATETKILDKDGELIYSLGGEKRDLITSEQVPQLLKDAITSIEDKRFYSHMGIDPIRIAGSFLRNAKAGQITQGGSTITQQLVKLAVFSTKKEDQTYKRKIQEIMLALQLERNYSKEQILTYYLNKVYMANNVYGFGTASHYYFNKELSDLSLAQVALLAGMPQAPNSYDPYANADQAKERRDLVLYSMKENGKISKEQYDQAVATPVTDGLIAHNNNVDSNDKALVYDSFVTMVLKEVQEKTGLDPYNDGLTIETTIDSKAQQRLYDIVNTNDYIQYVNDKIQNAVVMLDTKTGAVRAVNGGRKQTTLLGYNRATDNSRSTGSTIKPVIDYGPAIEYLNYSTGQTIIDQRTTYSNGVELNNWDFSHKGAMTLRTALVYSRNTTALQTFKAVGETNIKSFLDNLDIQIKNDGQDYLVESNSIGADISPIKMAAAYATFGNYGNYSKPYTVTKVTTRDGQVTEFKPEQKQAMKDSTAYMITDVLKDSFKYGFATQAAIPGLPTAAKTGSSNYTIEQKRAMGASDYEDIIPDSWFIGYSTDYTISAWTGYDNPYEQGGGVDTTEQEYSRLIYYYLMKYMAESSSGDDWVQPDSVVKQQIEIGSDPLSLPGPRTPANMIATELFVKGHVPTQQSMNYGTKIEGPTGLKATYDKSKKALTVTWDNYQTNSKDKPQYKITVNGQTQTVSTNKVTFQNISGPSVSVTLVVTVGKDSSDPITNEFQLEQPTTAEERTTQQNQQQNNRQQNNNNSNNNNNNEQTTQEARNQ
ncbi:MULTISPECIES: PBP1A family penicillin-binding protein [unclassified Granulicatella]|uniref:transglycosylase domain-containing protein n=1 Tax=unclassified Granulicatella TaxID=2630493 RepID=UPI00255427A7|nr:MULTISPECIES: PBP1A family penicillin-binding protein [unclassified Granulicatella]MDK8380579.1 PBP1A family penicillin-binding protein [Granulicatella sp. UMB5615B]MDK8523101.1 PBP1A family penicillin-binding protein [Granulicatella sp. UMB5615A]